MFCVASSVAPAEIVTFPASVPPLSVNASTEPPVLVIVPPLIVPPCSLQAADARGQRQRRPGVVQRAVQVDHAPAGAEVPQAREAEDAVQVDGCPVGRDDAVVHPVAAAAELERLAAGDGDDALVDERIVGVVAGEDAAAARDGDAAADGQRHRVAAVVPPGVQFVGRVAAERHRAAARQRLAAVHEIQHAVGAAAGRTQVGRPVERQAARHVGVVLAAVDVLRGVQGRARGDRYIPRQGPAVVGQRQHGAARVVIVPPLIVPPCSLQFADCPGPAAASRRRCSACLCRLTTPPLALKPPSPAS